MLMEPINTKIIYSTVTSTLSARTYELYVTRNNPTVAGFLTNAVCSILTSSSFDGLLFKQWDKYFEFANKSLHKEVFLIVWCTDLQLHVRLLWTKYRKTAQYALLGTEMHFTCCDFLSVITWLRIGDVICTVKQ